MILCTHILRVQQIPILSSAAFQTKSCKVDDTRIKRRLYVTVILKEFIITLEKAMMSNR